MAWRSFLFGAVGLLVSAALIYFAKPIAQYLLSSFGIETEDKRPIIANAIQVTGKASIRVAGRGSYDPVDAGRDLHLRDEIKTERKARIHLKFNSGYEIEVLEESQAILDIWSSRGTLKPEYISFIRGDYRLIQKGTPGLFYIVLDDEVFAPELRPEKSQHSFKIDPSATGANEATARNEAPKPNKNKDQVMPDKVASRGAETLSVAYIESVFTSRSPLFRRCQLTSLRDNKLASGNMLFSLVIEPNGRVKKVKLLQKNLNNKNLETCVSSVIERTKFKPFEGTAISLSYPLNFQ